MDGYSSKAWNSCFKDHLFQYGNKDCDGIDEKKKNELDDVCRVDKLGAITTNNINNSSDE